MAHSCREAVKPARLQYAPTGQNVSLFSLLRWNSYSFPWRVNSPLVTDGSIWKSTENNHQWQPKWKQQERSAALFTVCRKCLIQAFTPSGMFKYDGRSSCDPHLEPHSGLCSAELLLAPGFSPANQINLAWQTTRPQVLACSPCCSTLAVLGSTKKLRAHLETCHVAMTGSVYSFLQRSVTFFKFRASSWISVDLDLNEETTKWIQNEEKNYRCQWRWCYVWKTFPVFCG